MMRSGAKRFYKGVTVATDAQGFAILLDGRAVKTPGGNTLRSPTRALADALLEEWDSQRDVIDVESMRLTKFLNSAIDRVESSRSSVVEALTKYVETELICYRAEHPVDLVRRQAMEWDPWVGWAEKKFGIRPMVTNGVIPVLQPDALSAGYCRTISMLNDHGLIVLHEGVTVTGSAILGLALCEGLISADDAFRLSSVEASYQAELWGEDVEATRAASARRESLRSAQRYGMLALATGA